MDPSSQPNLWEEEPLKKVAGETRGGTFFSWKKVVGLTLMLLGVLGLILGVRPIFIVSAGSSAMSRQYEHLLEIHLQLIRCAEANFDHFPDTLAYAFSLETDVAKIQNIEHFRSPVSGRESAWIYYPGYTMTSDRETILVASEVFHQKPDHELRLILTLGGAVTAISDRDFQKRIKHQESEHAKHAKPK